MSQQTPLFVSIRLICFLGAYFLTCSFCNGQDPYSINFSSYHGLPSTEIYDVELDSNGIAWFCTDRGVCSFDGYEFRRFTTREGLSNNTMLQVHKDPEGRLWFLALDGSMSHTERGGLVPYAGNSRLIDIVGRDRLIIAIYWGKNGDIHLVHKNSQRKNFCQVVRPNGDMRRAASFEELQALSLKGTLHGIRYTKVGKQYVFEAPFARVLIPKEKDVYYTQSQSREILVHGRLLQKGFRVEYRFPSWINGLYSDNIGDLWVSTSAGLYNFPEGDLTRKPRVYFRDKACSSAVQDREGNFWITTLDQGVLFVPSMKFQRVQHTDRENALQTVVAMGRGKDHLFFSTQSGSIHYVDHALEAHQVMQDEDYFGLLGYGKHVKGETFFNNFVLREENGRVVLDSLGFQLKLPFTVRLKNGDLLNAGHAGFKIRRGTPSRPYFASAQPKSIRIFCAVDQGETIWMGTMRGLLRIDNYDYAGCSRFRPELELLQCRINDLLVDPQGNLWIGTIGNGLFYMHGDTLIQLAEKDGLNCNMINRIHLGEPGTLWVASNEGVYRIDYTNSPEFEVKNVRNFNIEDGLPTNFIRDVAVWSNQIWLATDYGLVYFSPFDFQTNNFVSPAIFMQELKVNQISKRLIDGRKLEADQNNIYLRYLGVSHRKIRGKEFYRYRLIGYDSSWVYTNDRSVQYHNLPGGRYQFQVMARNKSGNWSARPAHYAFVIEDRFSDSAWFPLLLVVGGLLIGGLVMGVWRWQAS